MTSEFDMDRRGMMQRMLVLVGATAMAAATPEAFAKPRKGRPVLDAPRQALLVAVAGTIVPKTDTPGAIEAGVPAKFEGLLANWASPERRLELIGALDRIDAMALAQGQAKFAALPAAKQHELLATHDIASLKNVPRAKPLTGMAALMAPPSVVDPGYAKLKELVVLLYYYSEEALTTELVYEHSPGGWTPSVKVTPETRGTGGLGMF